MFSQRPAGRQAGRPTDRPAGRPPHFRATKDPDLSAIKGLKMTQEDTIATAQKQDRDKRMRARVPGCEIGPKRRGLQKCPPNSDIAKWLRRICWVRHASNRFFLSFLRKKMHRAMLSQDRCAGLFVSDQHDFEAPGFPKRCQVFFGRMLRQTRAFSDHFRQKSCTG